MVRLRLLAEERDLEPRRTPARRDAREQVGDLALVGEPGLGAAQLGRQIAELALGLGARVRLRPLALELETPLGDAALRLGEGARLRAVPVLPVEHRDGDDDAGEEPELLPGWPIEHVVEHPEDHRPAPGPLPGLAADASVAPRGPPPV